MGDRAKEEAPAPRLSKIRTFLFGALAFVWFSEMVLWGFPSIAKMWSNVWNLLASQDSQLAMAHHVTHAIEAAAKGALGVLAVFGLRSRNPATRSVLFASMALVPPLNIAFQFRVQGFPPGSVAVATGFSLILWGSFFAFPEPSWQPEQHGIGRSRLFSPSRWEILQYFWFAGNSVALTLTTFYFLFNPGTALEFVFPFLSTLLRTDEGGLSSLVLVSMAVGSHLLALATATWIATVYSARNSSLRNAVTVASAVHAALLCVFALRQIVMEVGANRAMSSLLVLSVPLLIGWVLYAAVSYRVQRTVSPHLV